MRLLSVRPDHGGGGIAQEQAEADRCRHRSRDDQHLPLRHLPADPRGDPRRGKRLKEARMNFVPKINRRAFVVGSAAAGGLMLGIGPKAALAAPGDRAQFSENLSPNELGIWVAVKPDDTVAIRVVRAEMGQGSQTGLAQLIAEELDADWSKVTVEYPTPADNVKRKRAWGNFNSSGSRAIRESNQYVREGGAAAR